MKLSIIILSWNEKKLVTECVQSILKNIQNIDFELIVIDNASRDDSVKALQKFGDRIRLICNPTNRGYAGGNNQGFELAQGEYMLLLNQDVLVAPRSIETMVQWLDQHSEYGAATTTLKNIDGTTQYYMHRRFPTIRTVSLALLHKRWTSFCPRSVRNYLYLDKNFTADFDIEQAAGTCIMLRRAAIDELGYLFDAHHFPIYYNDVDLCFRLWQRGWKIRCLTSVSITHYKGVSVRRIPKPKNSLLYLKAIFYYFFVLRRSAKSFGEK